MALGIDLSAEADEAAARAAEGDIYILPSDSWSDEEEEVPAFDEEEVQEDTADEVEDTADEDEDSSEEEEGQAERSLLSSRDTVEDDSEEEDDEMSRRPKTHGPPRGKR